MASTSKTSFGIEAVRELTLPEIRRLTGATQIQLARLLDVDQPVVSVLETKARENIDSLVLRRIRKYVAAFGGELELFVKLGDERIRVHLPSKQE